MCFYSLLSIWGKSFLSPANYVNLVILKRGSGVIPVSCCNVSLLQNKMPVKKGLVCRHGGLDAHNAVRSDYAIACSPDEHDAFLAD